MTRWEEKKKGRKIDGEKEESAGRLTLLIKPIIELDLHRSLGGCLVCVQV